MLPGASDYAPARVPDGARVALSAAEIVFRYRERGRRLAAVRLLSDLYKRGEPPAFRRVGADWQLRLPRPPADRIEYLLELERPDGRREVVADPAAPVADGPLGANSVLLLPGYEPPAWLDAEAPAGQVEPLAIASPTLRATVTGLLWAPASTKRDSLLPLLLAHDGPEYARYSSLIRFLDTSVASGSIPPLRAALLAPLERDEHYSASSRYTLALARDIVPTLVARTMARRDRVAGMGASLGALSLLHVHRRHPAVFCALFLQSGSFFRRGVDDHHSGFPRFDRIVRFVRSVLRPAPVAHPVPVTLTCGSAEENLSSNLAMAAALVTQGYEVMFGEVRDGHNWVAWRDAFAPHLADLLRRHVA
jgi:enterochelin esterase-like enzyme